MMKRYVGGRYYKPQHWDRWQWEQFISELRGDCEPFEGIESDTDVEGRQFYRRFREEY